jgi:hypothetical protein
MCNGCGIFDRRSDCLPHSARVSAGQFLGQAIEMPVFGKISVQVGILSCKELDSGISGVFSA